MNVWIAILIAWGVMALMMLSLWFVQRRTRNAGIVDVAWSFGTGVTAVWFALVASGTPERRLLIAALALIWSVRLGVHLARRVASEREDARYRQFREEWGDKLQSRLFWFFQLQATWAVIFALPMLIAARSTRPGLDWLDGLGLLIAVTAFTGETIADRQLAAFRRQEENKGKVCRRGLWRYSRHPNYFFEWVHWFAYIPIAAAGPWWGLTLAGPVVMFVFLVWITGVPPNEAHMIRSRGDAYRRYQETTSVLIPWFPRRDGHRKPPGAEADDRTHAAARTAKDMS